MKTVMINQATS